MEYQIPLSKTNPYKFLPKCTSTLYESVGLISETPIFSTVKIHSLFIQCPNNAFSKNLDSHFDYQQDPT